MGPPSAGLEPEIGRVWGAGIQDTFVRRRESDADARRSVRPLCAGGILSIARRAPPPAPSPGWRADASGSLRIATYNIHRSIGTDGRHDPERTVQVILETGAAVVALQEVEAHSHDPDALSRATGMTAVYGHTMRTPRSTFGNLLLTHLAVAGADTFDLSLSGREPRGLIDARLKTPRGLDLRVLATHLGLSRRERLQQHRLVTERLARDLPTPTVLMGDFNEWCPYAGSIATLDRLLGHSRPCRSYPSRLPLLPLDRIWVYPPGLLGPVWAWTSPLARLASDHLPVVAELRRDGRGSRLGPERR